MQHSARSLLDDALSRSGLARVPRAWALLVAACAIGLLLVGVVRWWPSGEEFSAELTGPSDGASAPPTATLPASSEGSSAPTSVYVHVVGAVRTPGLVSIPRDSRVADCIAAAGGLLSNAQPRAVNLARPVTDGEQIIVPTLDEWESAQISNSSPGATGVQGSSAGAAVTSKVNLNTADAMALDALPGVGPSTAAKIIADREANGPFSAPEDLMRVSGIGAKKFEALKDFLTVQ